MADQKDKTLLSSLCKNKGRGIPVGFIGAGRTATAIAPALLQAGWVVAAVSSLGHDSATNLAKQIGGLACRDNQAVADKSKLVFITTPSDVIPEVVKEIDWRPGQMIVHCSGADSKEVLGAAVTKGALAGVLHPLQSFAMGSSTSALEGITFSLEADEPLLSLLKGLVGRLKANWIVIQASERPLYHASAAIVSNYLVTLLGAAAVIWTQFGASSQATANALLPLMKGTIANIEKAGLPNALTGPISRGDVGTVKQHLKALRKDAPEYEALYRELGRVTIPIARAAGTLDSAGAERISRILSE